MPDNLYPFSSVAVHFPSSKAPCPRGPVSSPTTSSFRILHQNTMALQIRAIGSSTFFSWNFTYENRQSAGLLHSSQWGCFGFKCMYSNFNATISLFKICISKEGFLPRYYTPFLTLLPQHFSMPNQLRVFLSVICVLAVKFLKPFYENSFPFSFIC